MSDPTRLREDPDFFAQTGCDLREEEAALGGYDLERLRATVLTSSPSSTPPRRRPRWLAAGASGLVLTIGLWAALASPPPAAPPLATSAPAAPAPIAATPPPPTAPRPQQAPPIAERAPEPRAPLPTPLPPPVKPPAPTPPPAPAAPEPASTLAQELADFERARSLADDGRWEAAEIAYRDYLAAWPAGRLRAEALLGTLITRVQLGDAAGAEVLASQLVNAPELTAKREELLLLRAEALLALGRCVEAVQQVEAQRDPRAVAVRRACRKALKEAP